MSVSRMVINAAASAALWLAGVASGPAQSPSPSAGRGATGGCGGASRRTARGQSSRCACELAIRVEDNWDGMGASVPVRLTIRNKGAGVIYWFRSRPDDDSLWAVRGAAGKLIAPAGGTTADDTTLKVKERSYERVAIGAGKEFSYSTRLGRRRLPPGEYTLEGAVVIYLPDFKTQVELTSEPIKIRVTRER